MTVFQNSKLRLIVVMCLALFVSACSDNKADSSSLNDALENGTVSEYTCSMHPHVRSDDPEGSCPICGMDLIPVSESNDSDSSGEQSSTMELSSHALAMMEVQTSPVLMSSPVMRIELQGEVRWDSRHQQVLSAWSAGRLDRLVIDEVGEFVDSGQVIAELYSPELLSAQQEYLDAVQLLESSRLSAGLRASGQSTLRAAEQRLVLLGFPQEEITRLRENPTQANSVPIFASASGLIIEPLVAVGEYVERGQPLARLADPSKVWVELDLYPRHQNLVSVGQSVELYSRTRTMTTMGTVTLIEPSVDSQSRVVKARVELESMASLLRPGTFVYAQIESQQTETLLIPQSAVLYTGERSWVYVQNSERQGEFSGKAVTIGKEIGDFYEVKAGLKEGDLVVSRGAFQLDSEMQLQSKDSMMSMTSNTSHHAADPSDQKLSQLNAVVTTYFGMWEALIEDDLTAWQASAAGYFQSVENLNLDRKPQALIGELNRGAGHAHHVNDLSVAREQFYFHSKALISLVRESNVGVAAHVAFCPMARSGEGAEWLQPNRELRNPYFGAMMLRCGEMRDNVGTEQGATH